jgi:hypothetical protein
MDAGLRTEIPARRVAEILGAIFLLLWRITACPMPNLWRDWVALGALYWLLSITLTGKRAWLPVTMIYGLSLMSIYLWGNLPHAAAALRILP